MPLKRCQTDGKQGWKWGDAGKCYTGPDARQKAMAQALAIGDIGKSGDRMDMFEKIKALFKGEPDRTQLEAQLVLLKGERDNIDSEISLVEALLDTYAEPEVDEVEKEEQVEEDAPVPELPGRGVMFPDVAFVGASPSHVDAIRHRPFSGIVGKTLEDEYVRKAGLDPSRVYLTNIFKDHCTNEHGKGIDPTDEQMRAALPEFIAEMNIVQPRYIVALGKKAHKYIKEISEEWVPHPRAINILGNSGEVERKMTRLSKKVAEPTETFEATIIRKSEDQRLVTSVVMEPFESDTDMNWTTADQIEEAAHYFMKNFRLIDAEHSREDITAAPVESWVAREDTVINGQPVKAGSWVMTVKVDDDDEWSKVVSGEYTGFSIDAYARINPNALIA